MTPVPEDDLRELGGSNLTNPDFPRGASAPPGPDVRFVRSRYRLFRRDPGTDLWACACGRESCRRDARTWEVLSGTYHLWAVPPELLDRLVPVLRWTGVHFGHAPGVEPAPWSEVLDCGPAQPAVVSNYSDLSQTQRNVLLGRLDVSRIPSRATFESLVVRGLMAQNPANPVHYLITAAGMRARRMLEAGEVPDPPGISELRTPRTPRIWRLDDPEPTEEGLVLRDRRDVLWRRHVTAEDDGRWSSRMRDGTWVGDSDWRSLTNYAPLTEEPRWSPAPRTWRLGDPDPGEDGLEVVDCQGDVWCRRGGRWDLVEWAFGGRVSREVAGFGSTWSEVLEYAPLTERLHRDPKRARPADCLQVPMSELLETVQRFLGGTGSLSDLRRARLAGSRALGDSRRASR